MEKISGPGGAECYRITHPSGAEVTIAGHGGHLISWKTADGIERLFLSERADFSEGNAIRGGVPVIFPQFNANGPYPRHGFARKAEWTPDFDADRLVLASNKSTLEIWPFEFGISIGVKLSATMLEIEMTIKNAGDKPFSFQAALHTYIGVNDVTESTVSGLDTLPFHNEVTGNIERTPDDMNGIHFGTEVDRSYRDVGSRPVKIRNVKAPNVQIESESFPDVVVWNPGPGHAISDLPDDGWKKFICVESAQVRNGQPLEPGLTWSGTQRIRLA